MKSDLGDGPSKESGVHRQPKGITAFRLPVEQRFMQHDVFAFFTTVPNSDGR